jgi:hypothetical protein
MRAALALAVAFLFVVGAAVRGEMHSAPSIRGDLADNGERRRGEVTGDGGPVYAPSPADRMNGDPCPTCTQVVTISLFESETDTHPRRELTSWGTLRARLSRFDIRADKSGPAWSPVSYADGATRGAVGVERVYVAVMDIDDGSDPSSIHRRLTDLGFEHVIHSTHSSTPENPKSRAAVLLAEPGARADWPSFFPRLCALLTDGHTDPCTKDPSRIFYLPAAKPGGRTFIYAGHGRALRQSDLPELPETTAPHAPPVELGADGKLPHGRHRGTIRDTAASLAARIGGLDEEGLAAAVTGAVAPLLDDLETHTEEIRELSHSALAKYGKPAPTPESTPVPGTDGESLFREVRETLERHYQFEQPWHSVASALFIMQGWVAKTLPAVFYLIIKGRFGGGKTALLNLISALGGGVTFENVSVAALARELNAGRLVAIDEYDVRRPIELQSVLDSLVRQGYRRDAAPYTRYDAATRKNEYLETYGPKALTIWSFLDPSLESRGFIISAAPAKGPDAYELLLRNLWRNVGDLPERGAAWGRRIAGEYDAARLREIARTDEFRSDLMLILGELGANRNVEQTVTAQLVARMAGVNVVAELRSAVALRTASAGSEDAGDLEDAANAILRVVPDAKALLMEEAPRTRVFVRDLKREMDRVRGERRDRPISDNRLAVVLTELGFSESWKVRPRNRVAFDLPSEFVRGLGGGGADRPNRPNTSVEDENVRPVSPVRPPPPPPGSDPPEAGSWQEPSIRSFPPSPPGETIRPPGTDPVPDLTVLAAPTPTEPTPEALEAARKHSARFPGDYAADGPEREAQIQARAIALTESWRRMGRP